jgi:hypothetical protein
MGTRPKAMQAIDNLSLTISVAGIEVQCCISTWKSPTQTLDMRSNQQEHEPQHVGVASKEEFNIRNRGEGTATKPNNLGLSYFACR